MTDSPQYSAYDKHHSESSRERAERQAMERAQSEVARSPVGAELARLSEKINQFEQWKSGLQGRSGIRVTDNVIELEKPARMSQNNGGLLRVIWCKNGVATYYDVDAVEVGPV